MLLDRSVSVKAVVLFLMFAIYASYWSYQRRPVITPELDIEDSLVSVAPKFNRDNNTHTIWHRYEEFVMSNLTYPPLSYEGIMDDDEMVDPLLQRLCNSTTWKEGVYLLPDPFKMGVFNAKNRFQNAVRLCVAAGLHLVIPKVVTRSKSLSVKGSDTKIISSESLFDIDHLREALRLNCPQMIVLDESQTSGITFNRMSSPKKGLPLDPQSFVFRVDNFIKNFPNSSISTQIRYFHSKVTSEIPEQRYIWGKLVRYRPLLVSLAKSVIKGFRSQQYAGIHVRLEADFAHIYGKDMDLRKYANLSLGFIDKIHSPGDIVYVAVGDQKIASEMEQIVEERGFKFESKTKFVEKNGLTQYLQQMNWDEAGLIDYLVLLGSKTFVGSGPSTFSYTLFNHRKTFSLMSLGTKSVPPNTFLLGNEDFFWDLLWH